MSYHSPSKKPTGGRPLRTVSDYSDSSSATQPHISRWPDESLVEPDYNILQSSPLSPQFDEIPLSPENVQDVENKALITQSPKPLHADSKPLSDTVEPPPSKLRWDVLRRHVLYSPALPILHSPTASEISSPKPSALTFGRPSTPKSSRFPRLGLRQVVDTAREVAAHDVRKFTEELERACAEARFVDLDFMRPLKREREPSQNTVGSYLSLHLSTAGSTSTLPMNSATKQPPQKPPSSGPSVNSLLRTLERYESSPVHRPHRLPLENQVLSALLVPFLNPGIADMERELALRAFILVVTSWKSEGELDRCLWCCKAASTRTRHRTELLGALSSLLFSRDTTFRTDSPIIFQTLLQGLFPLYPLLSPNSGDMETIRTLVSEILNGGSGTLSMDAIEQEFGSLQMSNDSEQQIREALATECIARCVANGSGWSRSWILQNLVEELWPLPPSTSSMSPLLTRIHSRKIDVFARGAQQLLMSGDKALATESCDTILRLVETRILPEIASFPGTDGKATRTFVIRLVFQVLCTEAEINTSSKAACIINQWFRNVSNWKAEVEKCLSHMIEVEEIHVVVHILNALKKFSDSDVQKTVFAFSFPKLCERLVSQSFPTDDSLPELLQSIAEDFPQLFFKPLFACAASNKELSVVNQLCVLISLSTHLPNLWTFDAEMMAVALMGTSVTKEPGNAEDKLTWDRARLGPAVILLELIGRLRVIRQKREQSGNSASDQDRVVAFAASLDSRLAILLSAKERHSLVPFSQRILFCALFFEMRLLTRSLKPTGWLSKVVTWVTQWHTMEENPIGEVISVMKNLLALYSTAIAGFQPHHSHRSTVMLSPSVVMESLPKDLYMGPAALLTERIELISSFSPRLESSALPLLVALSGLLSTDHYVMLAPILWDSCLDDSDGKILLPACFLVMQGAEKCPTEFTRYIQNDINSPEPIRRQQVIRRLAILLSRRLQILSQSVILDRSYRRPFKSTRHPISFVPADIGFSQYVREEDHNEIKDKTGNTLPLELRKRLLEIGWEEDDKPIDQQLEWAKTPMSLLPSTELTKVGGEDVNSLAAGSFHAIFEQVSQKSAPKDMENKRKSLGDITAKRRPVFVTPLVSFFPQIASLVFDTNFPVANAARNLLLDLMRDDPSILSRTVFNIITGNESELASAISTLRAFLHVRQMLPPAAAHHVFTHLTGYLKFAARQIETADALQSFAYTVPVLAKLISQVSNMSIREIRRAKIEVFVIPTLSLWFPPTAPVGPMFPRSLGESQGNQFEVSTKLTWITMIRTSQNMLFYSMLKKNPQDVHVIRKNLTRLVLPQEGVDQGLLDLTDFIPQKNPVSKFVSASPATSGLSLILSRSYLLLVAQVFRSMSRHTNDREDFAVLVEGINRILVTHGDDIGIVGQAMVALMAASTRFRRLFTSSGGYTLFMPAVFKIYAEAGERSAIRLAVEYAINRFYALHQEAFVFQTLDVISLVLLEPDALDMTWAAKALYSLLSTLKSAIPPTAPDPAGIHDVNKGQEREALIVSTVEEKPQSLFDHIRKVGRNEIDLDVPEEYEGKRFALDDIVRIFLTVIAHNPTIARANHFLRVFRYLTPDLYHASNSARLVLTEGVEALGTIFMTRPTGKTKHSEAAQARPGGDMKFESFGSDESTPKDRFLVMSNSPVDLLTMRMEYLSLIVAFTSTGGVLKGSSSLRVIELVKMILRDSRQSLSRISTFLGEYTKTSLLRTPALSVKHVVTFLNSLAPVVLAHHTELNIYEILITVSRLTSNPLYANDRSFSRTVVTQYCNAGLAACELGASEGLLFSLPVRLGVVDLMTSCVTLHGVDLVSQLEKRTASYEFLAGVVLPFTLALKPTAHVMAEVERTHSVLSNTYARIWACILAYVISICQTPKTRQDAGRATSPMPSDRRSADRRSVDRRSSVTEQVPISTLAICLQIIKVIVIKASEDLTSVLPDAWFRISAFLKRVLSDGDASFGLYPIDVSQPPSPIQSPRTSFSEDPSRLSPLPPTKRTSRPRVVDYLLWSLFELLCLHRTSLLLQMRLMMQEKIRLLDEQLQLERSTTLTTSSIRYSRRVSAVFSKRGQRSPKYHSSASSLDNSPYLRPSTLLSSELPSLNSTPRKVGREAGYLRSSPGDRAAPSGPHIVHLGPVRHSSLFRDFGPKERGSLHLVNSTVIKSVALTRATFRRIRLVQSCLGYSTLLPYPDGDHRFNNDDDDMDVSGWTKAEALKSILDETMQLIDEFSGRVDDPEFEEIGDNTITVDPDQSTYRG